MKSYAKLMEPLRVGTVRFKNRIIKAPQSFMYCDFDNVANDREIDAYTSIARGGAAAVIVGAGLPMFTNNHTYPFVGFYDDGFVPGLRRFAESVHEYDCKLIAQLFVEGTANPDMPGGAVMASDMAEDELPSPVAFNCPVRGATAEDIARVKTAYVDAARRAQAAGWDGVEVHSANGYFLLSFLSRVWNKREDEYGCQSMENRTRLQREIVEEIRSACGPDFIVGVRMNGCEYQHERAMTIEEGVEAARWFAKASPDYLSVTAYGYGAVPFQFVLDYWTYPEPDADMRPYVDVYRAHGLAIDAAAAIKKAVSVPVFGVGRMDEDKGESVLEAGLCDAVLMGRSLWADNELPNKIAEGRMEDIVHCTRCATCEHPLPERLGIRCRVNPSLGRERELAVTIASARKKVVVVGAGPAGMEAARVAALRGHDVTLLEEKAFLGGHLPLATMIKGTQLEDLPSIVSYLTTQLDKLGVNVRKKTHASAEAIAAMNPDAVVVAAGGIYRLPDVVGAKLGNVKGAEALAKMAEPALRMFGADALNKLTGIAMPGVGADCVIIGCEIEAIQGAVFLAKRGKRVTIIDEGTDVGARMTPRYLMRALPWLEERGVRIVTGVTLDEFRKDGVAYHDATGVAQFAPCSTILPFTTPIENLSLARELNGRVPQVLTAGACRGPQESLIVDALRSGREVGLAL